MQNVFGKVEGIIDLEFNCIEIDGEEVTQLQCIQRIIELTGAALTRPDEAVAMDRLREAILIWAEVFPLTWW